MGGKWYLLQSNTNQAKQHNLLNNQQAGCKSDRSLKHTNN